MSTALASSHNEQTPAQVLHKGDERLSLLSPKALSEASYAALMAYVFACAEQGVAAHRRWERFGNFADVGERDAWFHAESDALVEMGSRPTARGVIG
jgi:hypothetical protein